MKQSIDGHMLSRVSTCCFLKKTCMAYLSALLLVRCTNVMKQHLVQPCIDRRQEVHLVPIDVRIPRRVQLLLQLPQPQRHARRVKDADAVTLEEGRQVVLGLEGVGEPVWLCG